GILLAATFSCSTPTTHQRTKPSWRRAMQSRSTIVGLMLSAAIMSATGCHGGSEQAGGAGQSMNAREAARAFGVGWYEPSGTGFSVFGTDDTYLGTVEIDAPTK